MTFLKPFYTATMKTNGQSFVTVSIVIAHYNQLLDHCSKTMQSNSANPLRDSSDLHDAASYAHDKLEGYYNCSSEHFTIATLMDPRMKLEYYKDPNKDEAGNQNDAEEKQQQFREVYDEYKLLGLPAAPNLTPTVAESDDEDNPLKHISTPCLEDEMHHYLHILPILAYKEDPLKWWEAHQSRLPILYCIARDYLAIPATSAPSEREFSAAGQLVTVRRTSLNDDSIQANMCLRSWISNGLIDIQEFDNFVYPW